MDAVSICLLIWVAGLLSVASGLYLWFSTSFGVELAILLRAGCKPKPGDEELETMTRREFSTWLILLESQQRLPRRLVHILLCPGCLSVHLSLTIGALCGLIAAHYVPTLQMLDVLVLLLTCTVTWPWLVCRLTASSIHP